MINIITTSLNSRTRGPKKVVNNLIKGLEAIDYPYVINGALDATNRLWIHDDTSALPFIKNLPERVRVIVGPNLYTNPENIPRSLNLSRALYIHPSENVLHIWRKKGYNRSTLASYPTGIDTEAFTPSQQEKKGVILYFKMRKEEELEKVKALLSEKNISYHLISYGTYKEEEYKRLLSTARYMIWLGCYESQGIALQEALSANIPVLVIDKESPENPYDEQSTSAPYFDETCGIKIKGLNSLPEAMEKINSHYLDFTPREFVLNNLELKKQALAFLDLYEKNWGYEVKEGYNEALINNGKWKRPLFYRLKDIAKLIWKR